MTTFPGNFLNQLSLMFSEHIYFDMSILAVFSVFAGLVKNHSAIFAENSLILGTFLLILGKYWAKIWIFNK